LSSIFLLRIVHCTGCTGVCLSVSKWLLSSQRHSTELVNRLAPVEGHRPFPMRHPPARQTRRQLCGILCPPVRQTRRQLCYILCPSVRQTRRQLCDILLINIWGLWSILDFPRIPTAFAASPTSRARLRDGAAEFGDGSATPEFFSASALRRQSLIIKVDTLIFTARLISASVHPAPTASVHPASLSIALSVLDSIALSVSFLHSDTLGVQWLSLSRYSA
jgi:hypothetical protein